MSDLRRPILSARKPANGESNAMLNPGAETISGTSQPAFGLAAKCPIREGTAGNMETIAKTGRKPMTTTVMPWGTWVSGPYGQSRLSIAHPLDHRFCAGIK